MDEDIIATAIKMVAASLLLFAAIPFSMALLQQSANATESVAQSDANRPGVMQPRSIGEREAGTNR